MWSNLTTIVICQPAPTLLRLEHTRCATFSALTCLVIASGPRLNSRAVISHRAIAHRDSNLLADEEFSPIVPSEAHSAVAVLQPTARQLRSVGWSFLSRITLPAARTACIANCFVDRNQTARDNVRVNIESSSTPRPDRKKDAAAVTLRSLFVVCRIAESATRRGTRSSIHVKLSLRL